MKCNSFPFSLIIILIIIKNIKNHLINNLNEEEEEDVLILYPYESQKFIFLNEIIFSFKCLSNGNIYFKLEKGNDYYLAITIYNSYSSLIKDTRRRKGLETFTFGKDITKNKIGVFENNLNLSEIYFIIYQKGGSTISKYLDYITLYTENDNNIIVDAYYETNKYYKFSDNSTHIFNFELRDFENYYLQYQIYQKVKKI